MNKYLLLFCAFCAISWAATGKSANQILIPKAQSVTLSGSDWLPSLGLSPQYTGNAIALKPFADSILHESKIAVGIPLVLSLDLPADSGGAEGYLLNINGSASQLRAQTPVGLFYGLQSLRQLLLSQSELSGQVIYDQPSSTWRGIMLDEARNFLPVSYLKSTVDRMAVLKLNRLHLHLSDDQGWRLQSLKWPNLTIVGQEGSTLNDPGFMSQAQYVDLQNYAKTRGVIIVPELDMPGHTNAVKASYPNLGCGADSTWPYTGIGTGFSDLCLSKDSTKKFASDILTELISLTQGQWIHIGGDEVSDPLYGSFVTYLDSLVSAQGKTTVGWEEITTTKINGKSLWQKWESTFNTSASQGWINSVCTNAYLDHAQYVGGPGMTWCSPAVTESNVYSLTAGTAGVEAPLFGELVGDTATSLSRLYPRIQALAEVAWTPSSLRSYSDYQSRAASLKTAGIPQGIDTSALVSIVLAPPLDRWTLSASTLHLELNSPSQIFIYGLNGVLIDRQNLSQGSNDLSTASWGQGLRLLEIRSSGSGISHQLIHLY